MKAAKPMMWKMYAAQMALSLLTSFAVVFIWSNCEPKIVWKKFFSDIFSNLVIVLLIAGMTGLFV